MGILKTVGRNTVGLSFTLFFLFVQAFAVSTKDENRVRLSPKTAAGAPPIKMQGTHRNNTFGVTVTNYGMLGNQVWPTGFPDSFDSLPSVSFEFPLNSKIEYLFQGAFWVGGIVNGDTLVSVGTDGWIMSDGEIFPSSNPAEVTAQKTGTGMQEITFNYTDTLTDTAFVGTDPADGRGHIPLNLSFLQKSFVFRPGFGIDSFAIIYLRLQNIGTNPIESLYFGLFMDNDVGHLNTPSYFTDDVAGFVYSEDIACIWDNDGDPISGSFRTNSPQSVTGIKLIGSSQPLTKKSFNWWTPNGDATLDWGPQQSPGRLNQSGGRGQPEGDAMRYYYMSNGEKDYDQVWSALNHGSTDYGFGTGWLPPLSPQNTAIDIANGFDARYLFSYGAFDLPVGDTLVLVFTAAIGKNLHIDPSNFANNLGASSYFLDPVRINQYRSGLRFGSLTHNISLAENMWSSGSLVLPPPFNVTFMEIDTQTVRLFLPFSFELIKGFNIFRATNPAGLFTQINAALVTSPSFDDTGLVENQLYWYQFTTVSTSDLEGPLGGLVGPAVPGRPQAPPNLDSRPDKVGNIYLSWQLPPDGDLTAFRIHRHSIGAFDSISTFFSLYELPATETSFVDPGSIAGQRYAYRVIAVDSFGLESPASETRVMRFVFGSRTLLLNRTANSFVKNPSAFQIALSQFHSRLLRRWDFASVSRIDETYPFNTFINPNPFTGFIFATYPVIVIHSSEFKSQPLLDNPSFLSFFNDFLEAGGKLIVVGHWPMPVAETLSLCAYDSSYLNSAYIPKAKASIWDDTRNHFGFECLFYPPIYPDDSSQLSNSFLTAVPTEFPYPVLSVDSARVDSFVLTAGGRTNYQYPTLPNVGYMVNRTPLEDLYTFGSILGGSDPKHGQTAAKKHFDASTGGGFVWFNFPLFFMQEDSAKKAFRQALADLGVPEDYPKADFDRNGIRNIIDITYLLNWVFLGEQFPIFDADEADVNCDRMPSAVDVVLFLRNVFLGENLPC